MRITLNNSDYIGAAAGILCIIHCIVTPLLFLINAQLVAISFLAVYRSSQNTSNGVVKVLFFIFWGFLFALVLNEPLGIFRIPELFTFLSAFSLSALHVYNLKYCKCEDENCCTSTK